LAIKKKSKSVLKRVRQSEHRRTVNRARKLRLKTTLKAIRALKDKAQSKEMISKAQAVIDKAARKGIIHRNKASRLKSSIVRKVATLA
jgi:small subunit ribosomal protein S20